MSAEVSDFGRWNVGRECNRGRPMVTSTVVDSFEQLLEVRESVQVGSPAFEWMERFVRWYRINRRYGWHARRGGEFDARGRPIQEDDQ
jgi:hypothetical protein